MQLAVYPLPRSNEIQRVRICFSNKASIHLTSFVNFITAIRILNFLVIYVWNNLFTC